MVQERWFYRSEAEWDAMRERLKQTPCPHCKVVGTLIRHGSLRGYHESSSRQKTVRAQRLFCSNRNARRGCGRTVSVWRADKIRRLSLTTRSLWRFLNRAVAGTIVAAIQAAKCQLSARTMQRVWKRFDLGQSRIRTALSGHNAPPELPASELPAKPSRRPAAHVLAHLRAAFPNADCPIAAFQHKMRTFFI